MATEFGENSKTGLHTLGFSYEIDNEPFQVEVSKEDGELRITLYDRVPNNEANITVFDDGICNHCTTVIIPTQNQQQFATYLRQVADMLSSDSAGGYKHLRDRLIGLKDEESDSKCSDAYAYAYTDFLLTHIMFYR